VSKRDFPLWISHRFDIRNVVVKGKLVLKEPLRVGAGKRTALYSLSDLPVLRLYIGGEEIPVIPGSSWKGVFRSRVETILKTLGANVCGGVPGTTCFEKGTPNLLRAIDKLLREPSEESREKVLREIWERTCLSCKMFGGQSYLSHVLFDDSYPAKSDEGKYLYSINVKTGIAIDRRSGAVKRRALYTVEFIEPGSVFDFRISMKNLPNYAIGLIAWTLIDLWEGNVRIGGFKSRGFGMVEFSDISCQVIPDTYLRAENEEKGILFGFTDSSKPWYDEKDEDVHYDGGAKGLLTSLKELSKRKIGGV